MADKKTFLGEDFIPRQWYNLNADFPSPAPPPQAKEEGKERTILFNWSGHGLLDLAAYDAYLSKKLKHHALSEAEIDRTLAAIKDFPKPGSIGMSNS